MELLVLSEVNEEKEICWNLGGQKVFRMQLAEVGEAALWEKEVGESALWKGDVIETLWEDIFEEGRYAIKRNMEKIKTLLKC